MKPTPKRKKVKVQLGYCCKDAGKFYGLTEAKRVPADIPVAVLDLSNPEQLVEQVAKVLFERIEPASFGWSGKLPCGMYRRRYLDYARAVLKSLGIPTTTNKGGK